MTFGSLLSVVATALLITCIPAAAATAENIPLGPHAPGTEFSLSIDTLPPPYATPAVANSVQVVRRPPGHRPSVAPGLQATLFADGLDHARWLAVAPDGAVFVAESNSGRITVLRDSSGDGLADQRSVWLDGLDRPHGMAFGHGGLYIADQHAVWFTPFGDGDTAANRVVQVTDDGALGRRGGHWTRTITLSADQNTLFVAIGSRSNAEPDPLPRATIQAFTLSPDGQHTTAQRTYASGLRNPVGLALGPDGHSLWTVVNERDGLGDELVPDFLTQVLDDTFYGWPYTYLGSHPQPGLGPDPQSRPILQPDLLFYSHSAPLGLAFAPQQGFVPAWAGDAFVALHGSWNAAQPRGYAVVRVPFAQGRPMGQYQVVVSGFWLPSEHQGTAEDPQPATVWGRPAGLAFDHSGALLIADDLGQTLWRVAPLP